MVQLKCKVGDKADRLAVDEKLVPNGPGWELVGEEFSIIDVGNGLKVKAHCSGNCQEQEHDRSVDHKSPLDASAPCAIERVKQCTNALEE